MLQLAFVENVTKSRHGLPSDDEISSRAWLIYSTDNHDACASFQAERRRFEARRPTSNQDEKDVEAITEIAQKSLLK